MNKTRVGPLLACWIAAGSAYAGDAAQGAQKAAVCVACHDFRADRGEGEEFRTRPFAETFLRQHGFEIFRRESHPDPYVRDHLLGLRKEDV